MPKSLNVLRWQFIAIVLNDRKARATAISADNCTLSRLASAITSILSALVRTLIHLMFINPAALPRAPRLINCSLSLRCRTARRQRRGGAKESRDLTKPRAKPSESGTERTVVGGQGGASQHCSAHNISPSSLCSLLNGQRNGRSLSAHLLFACD